ncbi:MAG: Dimethyladenosine transferase methylation [Frankiales bacterium]|nr:Dimethyladenosine transferase methylation [Frankiales bacterium]
MADTVSVERVIPAAPEAIFALLADPAKHAEIDGSGSLVALKGDSQQLQLGSTFGMSMKMGVPYSMQSTVVEYEPNRRIAWQTRGPGAIGRRVGGRIWRYELEPVDGGTRVTESWDISKESPLTRPMVRRAAEQTRKNMTATLERIEQVLCSS